MLKKQEFFRFNTQKIEYDTIEYKNDIYFNEQNQRLYIAYAPTNTKYIKTLTSCDMLCSILDAAEDFSLYSIEKTIDLIRCYPLYIEPSLNIHDIWYDLKRLYALFACYKVTMWNESTENINAWVREWIEQDNSGDSVISDPYKRYQDNQIICNAPHVDYQFHHDQNGELKPFFYANCLYDALLFQIMTYIATGESGKEGASLSCCERCGTIFVKDHGSRILCNECRKSSERQKAYRERKKERNCYAPQD